MTVSVLIPYKPDGGERDWIWSWVRRRWELTMRDYEFIVASDGSEPDAPFNEGKALNECARQATGDMFVVAQTDLAFDPQELEAAISDVSEHGGWRVAERYYHASFATTQWLLSADPAAPISDTVVAAAATRAFIAESVAPILIFPREAFDLVGGYDERYESWGWLDKAFAAALSTLYKPLQRFPGAIYHLHHSRTEHKDCNPELSRRYLAAEGNRDAMRRIIEEH